MEIQTRRLCWIILATLMLILTGVGHTKDPVSAAIFPDASWERRIPEQVGMDAETLQQFANTVGGAGVVIREGYQILSWGGNIHGEWASATKPVLVTLQFFAIEEGKIGSPEDPIRPFVRRVLGRDLLPADRAMTFAHLANMISGYARGEGPGERWAYNDFGVRLLQVALLDGVFNTALTDVVGVQALLTQRLDALQFQDGQLFINKQGPRINMTPRDFARIGWLWLNRGNWQGVQLLPEKYFEQFVKVHVPSTLQRSTSPGVDYLNVGTAGGGSDVSAEGPGVYGFGWWFNAFKGTSSERLMPSLPPDAYKADGHFGQEVMLIIPSQQIVVAARGNWGGFSMPNARLLIQAIQTPPIQACDPSRPAVAYWPLDEGAGPVVNDTSGNGLTGIIEGARWMVGLSGNALRFDGANDEVVIERSVSPPLQGTVALWMRPEIDGRLMRVLGGSDDSEILVTSSSKVVNQFFAAGNSGLESQQQLTTETWVHLAVTYDHVTGEQQIYIDGQLDSSSLNMANDDPGNVNFTLGNRTGANDPFSGVLDDIRMYDCVLSANHIMALASDASSTNDDTSAMRPTFQRSWQGRQR